VIGIALRSAFSLGYHIRNEDLSATIATQERHIREWWALYSLERTLGVVTGRPSTIVDSWCSVPWPTPIPEQQIPDEMSAVQCTVAVGSTDLDSSMEAHTDTKSFEVFTGRSALRPNSGQYFRALAQLSNITQSILESLYSEAAMIRSQGQIQQQISQLGRRLHQWVAALPTEFNCQHKPNPPNPSFPRERMVLGFQLCSAWMLLTRPALDSQSQPRWEEMKVDITKSMAAKCIEAAKMAIDFLPEVPDPLFIYNQGPWWCVVHHMMQAMSIFLLGLSSSLFTLEDRSELRIYVGKTLLWLRSMPDQVAERAHSVALKVSRSVVM
jgi:hypothetical protein